MTHATRMRMRNAVAATLLLGVAATACTDAPDQRPDQRPSHPTERPPPPTATPSVSPVQPPALPTPAPTVLTRDDHGRTVTLARGATTQLRLPDEAAERWDTPTVDGGAVELVPVDHESDPGYRAWDLRAVRPGQAVVRATGTAGRFHLTVVVTG